MTAARANPGSLMALESAQGCAVFDAALRQSVHPTALGKARAIYTIARGSSDAAANIIAYEFMRELGVPVTSLPPSVFSLGEGVKMEGTAALVISQSGASDDLVRSAKGAGRAGAQVLAITNQPDSPVEAAAHLSIPVGAGPERAVPATKTVIGSIAAGMALLASVKPPYKARAEKVRLGDIATQHPAAANIQSALLRARHVYVIGRDTGYGTAQEVALKLKECCAIHAEAYSSSEVLHGPLQLAAHPLMVLMLDTGTPETQDSLNKAEARFRGSQCDVHRICTSDLGVAGLLPGAAAAHLLATLYPIILNTALALGLNPDAPHTLSKVTQTT